MIPLLILLKGAPINGQEPFQSIGDLEDALARWRAGRGLPDSGDGGRRFQLRTAMCLGAIVTQRAMCLG